MVELNIVAQWLEMSTLNNYLITQVKFPAKLSGRLNLKGIWYLSASVRVSSAAGFLAPSECNISKESLVVN